MENFISYYFSAAAWLAVLMLFILVSVDDLAGEELPIGQLVLHNFGIDSRALIEQ